MACKNCERLRAKLSPMENKAFTEKFKLVEPIAYYKSCTTQRRGEDAYSVKLSEVYRRAFRKPADNHQLTELGRTLQAIGWERMSKLGATYFVLTAKEFGEIYGTT